MRCEGYKKPGAFQLAPPKWKRCSSEATVMLTLKQEFTETFPSCDECWQECIKRGMEIIAVEPIQDGDA